MRDYWGTGIVDARPARPRLAEAGRITAGEIERFYELIDDPSFSVNFYTLVSARGRRPAG